MNTQEIIYIILLSIPLYVSLICGLLHVRMFLTNDAVLDRKPVLLAVLAYMTSAFGWLSVILYSMMPSVLVFLYPFLLLASMFVHVIYYHFIFEMTKMHKEEEYSKIHYFSPVILCICAIIGSLFVPFDKLFSLFFSSGMLLFFLWNVLYALFGLRRIIHYRKEVVNYSADEQRTSFSWLFQFLLAMLATLPMTVIVICLPEDRILPFWLIVSFIIVFIFKDIVFAHNVLLDNFVIIRTDPDDAEWHADKVDSDGMIKRKDIIRLENYMRESKPYLNPKLRITDMTRELGTNRTSLSVLINRTYEMNFSRYVNRFRLKELERIKKDPAYAGLSEFEQVIVAGFSDYRGYKRVKQREETETVQ